MNLSRGRANVPGFSRPKRKSPATAGLFSSTSALLDSCGLGFLRRLHQGTEGRGIVGRNVGQDLAIQLDPRHLQPMDELRVAGAVLLGGGVDAHDPQ